MSLPLSGKVLLERDSNHDSLSTHSMQIFPFDFTQLLSTVVVFVVDCSPCSGVRVRALGKLRVLVVAFIPTYSMISKILNFVPDRRQLMQLFFPWTNWRLSTGLNALNWLHT